MALVRVKLVISGRVQKVGYRYFVRLKAYDRDITGRVENLGDGTVRVVAEGRREEIQKFREDIDIRQGPILVKEVRQVGEEEVGERAHRDFAIGRTWMENALGMSDKLDLGIYHLRAMEDRIGKVEEHVVSAEGNISSGIAAFQETARHLGHLTELVEKIAEERAQRK